MAVFVVLWIIAFLLNLDNRNIQEDKERNFHIICTRSKAIDHLLLSHDSVGSVHNTIYPKNV